MTVGIVANFVSNNLVDPDQLPGLIVTVHASLANIGPAVQPKVEIAERLTPSAIRKLMTPDGIRSLIDGRVFKSMKRHLTLNGWTPESYREHFGLPTDFPIVHPGYSQARSALAKSSGLGSGGRKATKTAHKPRAARA